MTLEFAQREAARRTAVLGRTHYVIYAAESWADNAEHAFLVSTRVPDTERHIVVETFPAPEDLETATQHEETLAGLANERPHSRFKQANGQPCRWTYDGHGGMVRKTGD